MITPTTNTLAFLALASILPAMSACNSPDPKGGERSDAVSDSGVTRSIGDGADSSVVTVLDSSLVFYELDLCDSLTTHLRETAVRYYEDPADGAVLLLLELQAFKANLRTIAEEMPP